MKHWLKPTVECVTCICLRRCSRASRIYRITISQCIHFCIGDRSPHFTRYRASRYMTLRLRGFANTWNVKTSHSNDLFQCFHLVLAFQRLTIFIFFSFLFLFFLRSFILFNVFWKNNKWSKKSILIVVDRNFHIYIRVNMRSDQPIAIISLIFRT